MSAATLEQIPAESKLATANHTIESDAQLMQIAVGLPEITIDIPTTATAAEVNANLQLVISGYLKLAAAQERMKPLIGRILRHIKDHKLWKGQAKNWSKFILDVVEDRMGFSRSNAYEALSIAYAFPRMSAEEYARYGASRLQLVATVKSSGDQAHMDTLRSELLQESLTKSVQQFKDDLRARRVVNVSPTGEVLVPLSVRVPKATKDAWDALVASTVVEPADIIARMIASYKVKKSERSAVSTVPATIPAEPATESVPA
jgi:hypothetical protein